MAERHLRYKQTKKTYERQETLIGSGEKNHSGRINEIGIKKHKYTLIEEKSEYGERKL